MLSISSQLIFLMVLILYYLTFISLTVLSVSHSFQFVNIFFQLFDVDFLSINTQFSCLPFVVLRITQLQNNVNNFFEIFWENF